MNYHVSKTNSSQILTLGVQLAGLRRPPFRAKEDQEKLLEFHKSLLSIHTQFLAGFKAGPKELILELRILKNPSHSLSFSLLVKSELIDERNLPNKFSELRDFFIPWLTTLGDVYQWRELNHEELQNLLEPFVPQGMAEILRRNGSLSLDRRKKQTITVGFQGEVIPQEEDDTKLWFAHPYTSHLDTRESLSKVLLTAPQPFCLSITMGSKPLTLREEEILKSRISSCEKFAQFTGSGDMRSLAPEFPPILRSQAINLLKAVERESAQLRDNALVLKTELLSPGPIPVALISAVSGALTGPVGLPNPPFGHPDPETLAGGCMVWIPETDSDQKAFLSRWKEGRFNLLADAAESLIYRFDATEAVSAFRLPLPGLNLFPGIENIFYRDLPAPSFRPFEGTRLGVPAGGDQSPVFMDEEDRLRHMYVLGQTGTGKSTMLKNMIMKDLETGQGLAVIDPHGDLAKEILSLIPPHRAKDVIYFNPLDETHAFGLNLMEASSDWERDFVVNYFLEINNALYDERTTSGPVTEMYIRNALMLAINQPPERKVCLLDVFNVLQKKDDREDFLRTCTSPLAKDFWEKTALRAGGDISLDNVVPYIMGRFGRILFNSTTSDIFSQRKTTINFQEIMDSGKVLLVDLSKGQVGSTNAYFLAMLLLGNLMQVLYRRNKQPRGNRRKFYLFVDEFHNVATPTFLSLFAEARKFGLGMTVANQFFSQLSSGEKGGIPMKEAILGNVGSYIQFRLGYEDAVSFSKIYGDLVEPGDFQGLPNYRAYVRLLAKGQLLPPFTLLIDPPTENYNLDLAQSILVQTRETYMVPRKDLESRQTGGKSSLVETSDSIEDELKRLFGD